MATVRLSSPLKTDFLNSTKTRIDGGSGPGTIKVYTGTMPVTPTTAVGAQVLLGTLVFADPCGTVAADKLTMGAITADAGADAGGIASWARIHDSTGTAVMDIDVSNTGGVGAMKLNTVSVVEGGPILVSLFEITVP